MSQDMPKIKPLVWVEMEPGSEEKRHVASNRLGDFRYMLRCTGKWMAWVARSELCDHFPTEAEAKAWCQAEYERRVRECLE